MGESIGQSAAPSRPLLEAWPRLAQRVRFAPLAELPTPVRPLGDLARALGAPALCLYDKRDDLTSPVYGGNKVRTLEVLLGRALADEATLVFATGAYGSNHAAATAMHAPRLGLDVGVALYPQPPEPPALENLELVLGREPRPVVRDLPHWSALPVGILLVRRACRRRGVRAHVMLPGGAVPEGALGYVSAALELAAQVARGELPPPRTIVVAAGSNCTTAGLLVGLALAARMNLGLRERPTVVAVRVTPWPVTSRTRIVGLARRTSALLASLAAEPALALDAGALAAGLRIEGRFLGRGYGHPTPAGREAAHLFAAHAGHALETIYSAKAAAAFFELVRAGAPEPVLFWATKSSAPLARVSPHALAWAPARMRRWMERARRSRDVV
jgi:D-cysteine desulfhydrase